MNMENMKTGPCPKCGTEVEFEPCIIMPRIIPVCDDCDEHQQAMIAKDKTEGAFARIITSRMPLGYQAATVDRINTLYRPALAWDPVKHPGGIGLIGLSGLGKSSAMACVMRERRKLFLWWSGTEARDAAIEASTADRDREGAKARWEAGMREAALVLDDVPQGKMTEAWSAKLFDLLETRISAKLPVFWTSQISLHDLRDKIHRQNGGDDAQAAAIVRRLSQHSLVIG
jgi:hypothetical protein